MGFSPLCLLWIKIKTGFSLYTYRIYNISNISFIVNIHNIQGLRTFTEWISISYRWCWSYCCWNCRHFSERTVRCERWLWKMTTLLGGIVMFVMLAWLAAGGAGLMWNIHTTFLPIDGEWVEYYRGCLWLRALYKCNVLYQPAYFMVLEACYYLRLMMAKGVRPITFKQSQERPPVN